MTISLRGESRASKTVSPDDKSADSRERSRSSISGGTNVYITRRNVYICVYLLSGSRATKLRSVAAGDASRTTRISSISSTALDVRSQNVWTGIHASATLLVGLPEPALGRFTKYLLGRRTRRPHTIDGLTKTDSILDRAVPVVVSREPRAIAESLFLFSHATTYPLAEVGRGRQSCVCLFADDEKLCYARNFF